MNDLCFNIEKKNNNLHDTTPSKQTCYQVARVACFAQSEALSSLRSREYIAIFINNNIMIYKHAEYL